jgi:thioesterase domain-containing protein
VLRFDLGGIGDSVAPPGIEGGNDYPSHRLDDAREAIAFVRKEAPQAPVILAGLCSGGWLAFEAARAGLAVNAIISVNPPLYLRDGSRGWVAQQRQLDRYQQSMRNPLKRLKSLRSGTAATAMVALAQRAGRDAASRLKRMTGDRLPAGLASDLQAIAEKNITAFFIFSDGDNGHRYFEQHAPPALRRNDIRRLVQHVVVDDAGHVFRPMAAQRRLKSLLNEFVSRITTGGDHIADQKPTWTRRPV